MKKCWQGQDWTIRHGRDRDDKENCMGCVVLTITHDLRYEYKRKNILYIYHIFAIQIVNCKEECMCVGHYQYIQQNKFPHPARDTLVLSWRRKVLWPHCPAHSELTARVNGTWAEDGRGCGREGKDGWLATCAWEKGVPHASGLNIFYLSLSLSQCQSC